jgi:hypothetical protein
MTPRRTLILVAFASVTVVCTIACSKQDEPVTPTPTAKFTFPTEEPEPTEAPSVEPTPVIDVKVTPAAGGTTPVGPVLVYERGGRERVLVVYDLGAGRPLWSAPASLDGFSAITGVALAGREVIVATPRKVRAYGMDGTPGAELFVTRESEYVHDIAASKDGSKLAISLEGPPTPVGTPEPFGQAFHWTSSLVFLT